MGPLHAIGAPGSVGVGIQHGRTVDASFFAVCLNDRIGDADREIAQAPIRDIREIRLSGLLLSAHVGVHCHRSRSRRWT